MMDALQLEAKLRSGSEVSFAPLVFAQLASTRGGTLVCSCCGAFAAGAGGQIVASKLPTSAEALEAELAKVPGLDPSENRATYCSLGCGEIFCSPECEALAQASGHKLMCVGPLTEEAPMYHLKVVALHCGHNETMTLALKLVTMASAQGEDSAAAAFLGSAALAAQPPWREAEGNGAAAEELLDYIGEVYDGPDEPSVATLSWHLLARAVAPPACPPPPEALWARLLGYVSRRALPVERMSPLVAHLRGVPPAEHAARDWLLRWAEQLQREEEEEGEEGEEGGGAGGGEGGGEGGGAGGAGSGAAAELGDELPPPSHTYAWLVAECDGFVPKMEGRALLPALDALRPSCVPTCTLAVGAGGGALRLALRSDAAPCEPLSVCPFDTGLPHDERAARHRARGDACGACGPAGALAGAAAAAVAAEGGGAGGRCERCTFELAVEAEAAGAGPPAAEAEVDARALRRLARLAQEDHRLPDARAAFAALLSRDAHDGDALYEQARVMGWDDRWSEAHRLLEAAARRAPGHAATAKQLGEAAAYASHCGAAGEAAPSTAGFERVAVGDDACAFVSSAPLLPAAECARAIADAEAHVAAAQGGSWQTARHFAVPTTDLQLCAVPSLLAWFGRALQQRIFPALGAQYGVTPARMRVIDAFLVKYEAARGQVHLPLHADQSEYSLTLPLNDGFEGGGTYFVELGRALNCAAGGLVTFPGRLTHGAAPITAGVRYVIVAFLYEYHDAPPDAEA